MSQPFASVQEAFLALSDPGSPDWARAFSFLASHPDTAEAMLETFRETLEQMGTAASGVDPATGEPVYTLADVAGALGIPQAELDAAMEERRDQP